jgi:hypothetical protein
LSDNTQPFQLLIVIPCNSGGTDDEKNGDCGNFLDRMPRRLYEHCTNGSRATGIRVHVDTP